MFLVLKIRQFCIASECFINWISYWARRKKKKERKNSSNYGSKNHLEWILLFFPYLRSLAILELWETWAFWKYIRETKNRKIHPWLMPFRLNQWTEVLLLLGLELWLFHGFREDCRSWWNSRFFWSVERAINSWCLLMPFRLNCWLHSFLFTLSRKDWILNVKQEALVWTDSDHCPIYLDSHPMNEGLTPFRFGIMVVS